jgi:hypothetical protein
MNTYMRALTAIIVATHHLAAWAQGQAPGGPLYQIWQEKQAYFDVLRTQMTEEEFYQEGGEFVEFQRWFRYWEVRAPQGDPANYDLLMKSYCDAKFQNGGSYKSNSDPWHEIGPKGISNNMFGIGPIRHIAISKDNSDHMLCTSNSGGLFHTGDANGSCTWSNAGTDIGLPHSGCNWADFYPGSTEKWHALSSYGRISYVGGLYRTANSGAEWNIIADHSDLGGPSTVVHQFVFDRKLNNLSDHRLFLLTSQGLFVTDDPEALDPAWTEITIPVPASIPAYSSWPVDPNVLVYDMEYLASSTLTSTLCAAMRFKLTDGSNTMSIWRFMLSTDDGETWAEAPSQPAIDPDIEWATVETSAASPTAFHCMVEKGVNSWVKLFDITANQAWPTLASNFNPDFGDGHTFGVDQFNAQSLIVGDAPFDVNWYVAGSEVPFAYPYPPGQCPPLYRQYCYSSTGHDDVEDIVGDPSNPGIFWVANHGGVTRVNTNVSPRTWEYRSEGLGVAEVWSMSTSQNKPDYVALGLYHDCHLLTRTPYAPAWAPDWSYLNQYGDGTLAIVDHTDANIVYHATQPNQSGSATWKRNDAAETSDNGSASWSISPSQYFAEGALNRKEPTHLYYAARLGTELEIGRSLNRGTNRAIVSDFTNNLEVNHPVLNNAEQFWWIRSSPANPDHLYTGLQNYDWQQRIFRNTNIDHPDVQAVKNAWEDVPHPRRTPVQLGMVPIRQPAVMDMAFDPEDENIIYIAYASSQLDEPIDFLGPWAEKMVYRMNVSDLSIYPANSEFECDGTYPCQDITMNLPNTIVDKDCLEFEQGSDGGIYVATEVGVYFTDNKRIAAFDPGAPQDADDFTNTAGWVRLGGSLPHTTSIGLEINYQINRIRAGTTGRGVWEHGLHCPVDIDLSETGTYGASAFLEAQAAISSDAIAPQGLKVTYRGGSEVHLTPGFHAAAGSRFHAFIHPCDLPGNSFNPKSMEVADLPEEAEVETREADPSLHLFPNPAHSSLSVLCSGFANGNMAEIRVVDAMGRVVLVAPMQGPLRELEVSRLTGLFTVVVDSNGARMARRVIIQR